MPRETCIILNALWVTSRERRTWMWLHSPETLSLSLHVTHYIILPLVPLFLLSISFSTHLDPLALLSSIDSLPDCELKPSRRPLRQFPLIKLLETQ